MSEHVKNELIRIGEEALSKIVRSTSKQKNIRRRGLHVIENMELNSVIVELTEIRDKHPNAILELDLDTIFEIHEYYFTEKEQQDAVFKRFNTLRHFPLVYKMMLENGYERTNASEYHYEKFNVIGNTPYDVFTEKRYDDYVEYFLGYFYKKEV